MNLISRKISVGLHELHWLESPGTGRPVVFVHGNSMSCRCFEKQLQSTLGTRYHIIVVDLPGHGRSSHAKCPDETYTFPGYAETIADLSQALGLDGAIYVGWSLGGNILLEAAHLLTRAAGFMIFGAPPIGYPPAVDEAFFPHPAVGHFMKESLAHEEITICAKACVISDSEACSIIEEDVKRTDARCRSSLMASIMRGAYRNEIEAVRTLRVPLAILHGEKDQLVRQSYYQGLSTPTLWRDRVQTITAAGHMLQWEQPEEFNELLSNFLKDIDRGQ